jgi:hypothetical protein
MIHPDWGVDSEQVTRMLKEAATDIVDNQANVSVRFCVDEQDGVMYCEVLGNEGHTCEIHCVEPLRSNILSYLVLAESSSNGPEYEFHVTRRDHVSVLVAAILSGRDLAELHALPWT